MRPTATLQVSAQPDDKRPAAPSTTPARGRSRGRAFPAEFAGLASLPIAGATELLLLHWGHDHFDEVLHALNGELDEVAVERYPVRRDPIGRQLMAARAAAAHRGLERDRLGPTPCPFDPRLHHPARRAASDERRDQGNRDSGLAPEPAHSRPTAAPP